MSLPETAADLVNLCIKYHARIAALERLIGQKDEALRFLQKHLSVYREWHALGIVEAALDLTETETKSC